MRLLFPSRLAVAAVVVAVAIPELAKRFRPAAKAVGDGLIKAGESLKKAADEPDKPASSTVATSRAAKIVEPSEHKPEATSKRKAHSKGTRPSTPKMAQSSASKATKRREKGTPRAERG